MRSFMSRVLPDVRSGFIVFLIALPLSVGISIASGAPASAGLLSAIVGGIIGSWLGGSEMTINGSAAGLIVVVLGAIESLGQGDALLGFQYMLAAMMVVGLLQIALGWFKLANIGLAFPSSVVHGMLAAIGAIIIAKQFPVLLGVRVESKEILELYAEIPHELANLNPEVGFIGFASLVILFGTNWLFPNFAKKVPVPILVVIVGIGLGAFFDLQHEHQVEFWNWSGKVSEKALLTVPSNLKDSLMFPNFDKIGTLASIMAVFSILIIASIESVISTFAVDKLDPQKRSADLNRDLLSKGICNIILGAIGGLPIISEIVRSSANISNGAKTRKSNFFHGVFILVFLAFFPAVLHLIPLAALAAILIFVGWRLAHPSQLFHAYHVGKEQGLIFGVTFITTLATDLLVGVLVGVALKFVIVLYHGVQLKELFRLSVQKSELSGNVTQIEVQSPAVFSNSLVLRRILSEELSRKQSVSLDMSHARLVDHTTMDQLSRFQETFKNAGLALSFDFPEVYEPVSEHPLAARKRVN